MPEFSGLPIESALLLMNKSQQQIILTKVLFRFRLIYFRGQTDCLIVQAKYKPLDQAFKVIAEAAVTIVCLDFCVEHLYFTTCIMEKYRTAMFWIDVVAKAVDKTVCLCPALNGGDRKENYLAG